MSDLKDAEATLRTTSAAGSTPLKPTEGLNGAPSGEMPEQMPPFDLPAALARANGKPELLRKMLLSFRDQYKCASSELRRDIAEGKTEEASRLAHSLKAVAAALEAKDLANAAENIEHALRAGAMQGMDVLIKTMETALDPAIAAADSFNRRFATSSATISSGPLPSSTQPDMRILLVDDQPYFLEVLEDAFGGDTEVSYASDGLAALAMAAASVPDLILLDIMMAGIDGYEVFHRLKADPVTSNIPIIFVTGLGSVAQEEKALRMGACDYVIKPIKPLAVSARVTRQIGLRRAQQEREKVAAELARYTRALERSNRELDAFAYAASHDLKAPLRVIHDASTWIEEDLALNLTAEIPENMVLLRSRVRRMDKLLDDLLAYSRIGHETDSSHAEAISGAELMENILGLLSPPQGFIVHATSTFAGIEVFRMPLQQILINLISNALKHHDKKEGRIEVSVVDLGAMFRFSVKDDGPGIPAQYHEQVFKMFQTLKSRDQVEGSGLGLAMVRKHVEVAGGELTLESAVGQGSTFSFTWPKQQRIMQNTD